VDPVKPEYSGANVVNVVPALLGLRSDEWLPAPARDAATVVLLVLDGLGWDVASSGRMPVVGSMTGGPVTTVVPSTTAAALTSITTGVTPSRHGLTGYRIRFDDTVLNVIRWQRADGRRGPEPLVTQRVEPFAGRPVPVVSKSSFRRTDFTAAHLRGGPYRGWPTTAVLVEHVRALAHAGEPLVYAYYPGLDEVGHEFGIEGREFAAEVAATDELVGALLDVLPDGAALVVTADHGQVQVGPAGWRGLGDLDDLVATYAGEGRFRHLHARRGAATGLVAAARALTGDDAWVFTRDELLDGGWLGPDPRGPARRGVGDVVIAARGPVGFVDPTYPREADLVATHGSVTAAEMVVPLLASRGRA
jgi:hypothetical protein